MVSGDVFFPPTTSTRGMTCGGLKGCPMTQRPGWRQDLCRLLISRPEELEAERDKMLFGLIAERDK